MQNIYPFLNLPRPAVAQSRAMALAYIARAFPARHDGGTGSAAYRRDCIRDAIAAVRCCNAMLPENP